MSVTVAVRCWWPDLSPEQLAHLRPHSARPAPDGLESLGFKELRALARSRGLNAGGTAQALRERLKEAPHG